MSLVVTSSRPLTSADAVRGGIAGAHGVAVRRAAQALYAAGGRKVLPASVQGALRAAVEREASVVMASVGLLESSAPAAARALEGGAARAIAAQTVRVASRQVLRAVGSAAGAGALVDGGWALVQAVRGVRSGTMTREAATAHVAREATTGAAATAVGATAAVLLIALTGGVAAPAVFLVGAAASIGTKAGLNTWLDKGKGNGGDSAPSGEPNDPPSDATSGGDAPSGS